jgi:hypothetical protein
MQLWLDSPPVWHRIDKFLPKHLIAFVDEHYSRQTHGTAWGVYGPGNPAPRSEP